MSPDDLDKTEPQRLEQMLSLDAGPAGAGAVWRPDELAAIFRHQLNAQLEFDLGDVSTELPSGLDEMGVGGAGTLRWAVTFRDLLLHHPHPPLALLERAKRFAKACKNEPGGALPAEVATMLYFACIVVARLRCDDARISALDDVSLVRGLEWAVAQPWIDAGTRQLMKEGIAHLK
ncbi:MAG TPA: hypothetical protein VH518_18410 [Tepidisphaeraceae bacterium]